MEGEGGGIGQPRVNKRACLMIVECCTYYFYVCGSLVVDLHGVFVVRMGDDLTPPSPATPVLFLSPFVQRPFFFSSLPPRKCWYYQYLVGR